jgi:signal peptidase I
VRAGKLLLNGDKVVATDDQETLDGKVHALSLASGGGPDFGPKQVPVGKVLVMGYKRVNSRDGRMFGFVEEDAVLGRAVAVYSRDSSLTWDKL